MANRVSIHFMLPSTIAPDKVKINDWLFPDSLGVKLHQKLQSLTDRGKCGLM